jgi:hypothetical protein
MKLRLTNMKLMPSRLYNQESLQRIDLTIREMQHH